MIRMNTAGITNSTNSPWRSRASTRSSFTISASRAVMSIAQPSLREAQEQVFEVAAALRIRRGQQLGQRALRQHAAVIEDREAVADLLDLLHVVAGVDHGEPL